MSMGTLRNRDRDRGRGLRRAGVRKTGGV